MSDIKTLIKHSGPFKTLSAQDIADVAHLVNEVTFSPGEIILQQGRTAEGLYIIAEGQVNVTSRLPGGHEAHISTLSTEEIFGDVSLIYAGQATASIRAVCKTKCLHLSVSRYDVIRFGNPDLAYKINQRIAKNVCQTIQERHDDIVKLMSQHLPQLPKKKKAKLPVMKRIAKANCSAICDPQYLCRLEFFQRFSLKEIDTLLTMMELIEAPQNSIVYLEGKAGDVCYVPIHGATQVYIEHKDQRSMLSVHGPGNLLGQLSFIGECKRTTTCSVKESAFLLELTTKQLQKLHDIDRILWFKCYEQICKTLVQGLRFAKRQIIRLESEYGVKHV